jgi:predicted Zn-dependent protease
MLVMQQKATDALPYLLKAIKLRPDAIDPHRFLADAYTQLGQEANASRELAEAERVRAQGGSRLGTSLDDSGGDVK